MRSFQRSSFGARLRALRLAKGLSQGDLARLIGRHQTVIGPYERDEYEPSREIAERLAGLLDTSPEYLCFGRDPRRSAIPLAGTLGAMGLLEPDSDQTGGAALTLKDEQLLAFLVRDDSMAPVLRPGQLALVSVAARPPAGELGRDALVGLPDGRQLLRRLGPSAEAGRFDLSAYNAPALPGVAVSSVRPVLGALWQRLARACQSTRSAKGSPL
jgi:transcriptional regulator with XRE-family HTH domain